MLGVGFERGGIDELVLAKGPEFIGSLFFIWIPVLLLSHFSGTGKLSLFPSTVRFIIRSYLVARFAVVLSGCVRYCGFAKL